MYLCPFCGTMVEDTIPDLQDHRKPGGVCDTRMDEIQRHVNPDPSEWDFQ